MPSCGMLTVAQQFDRESIEVADCSLQPSTIDPGNASTLTVDVNNPNSNRAQVEVEVSVGPSPRRRSFIVEASSTGSVEIPVGRDLEPGSYDISAQVVGASSAQRAHSGDVIGAARRTIQSTARATNRACGSCGGSRRRPGAANRLRARARRV